MTVDCHTHLWREENWSEEIRLEGERMRGGPVELNVAPEAHWKAMEAVDKAIVFGLRAHHVGLVIPNDLIARYVAEHPDTTAQAQRLGAVLKGEGIPDLHSPAHRGDLYIKLIVKVPTKMSARAKDLLKELASVNGEEKSPKPIPLSELKQ